MSDKSISRRSGNSPSVKKGGGVSDGNKNKKLKKSSQNNAVNEHYLTIGRRLKFVRLTLLVLLVMFILSNIVINSKELSIDNLTHLLRYINIQNSDKARLSEFAIDTEGESLIGYYRNFIVVLRRNRLDIYNLNGSRTFSHTLAYSTPVLKISDRYILAFDNGSNKMQIFNSFSRLYEYKNEYNEINPIYGAKITDKGNTVYISSERGYRSVVTVMNNSFREIYQCGFGDKYVVDAAIDDDAKKLAVASFIGQKGDFLGEILLYDTGDDDGYQKKIVSEGEIPLRVDFNKNGLFSLFENSLKIFDGNYEKLEDYHFLYRDVEFFNFTTEFAAIVLTEKTLGNEKNILIFDYLGDLIYSEIINADIIDIKFSQDSKALYFLTRSGLYKIDIQERRFELLTAEYDDTSYEIIYADEKNIFVSGLAKVNIININTETED